MPGWWVEEPERLKEQIDDIMGVHDISRGEAGVNAPDSGYGLSILVEQDTTPVGRMVKETARVWSDVASFVLKLYEQQLKTKRKVAVAVPGQPPMTLAITGTDLQHQTTAYVPPDSIMPRSKAALMQLAQTMATAGFITSPLQFAKIAELPGMDAFTTVMSADAARAQRENALMAAGQVAIVKDFDDHMAHVMEHDNFRKSSTYEMLDPAQQKVIDTHVQGHKTEAAAQLGSEAAGSAINPALGALTAQGNGTIPNDPAMLAGPPPPEADPAAIEAANAPSEAEITQQILASMQEDNPASPTKAE